MNEQTRRVISYIVARLSSGRVSNTLYDYQTNSYFNFSGIVDAERVSIFDYDESNYVTGNGMSTTSGLSYNLFNYAKGSHIQLNIAKDGSFRGFDYGKSAHFNGRASQIGGVMLYDFLTGQHYNYKF